MKNSPDLKVLRTKDVCDVLNISETTLQRISKEDNFPAKRKISDRICGWLKSDIISWLDERAVSDTDEVAA